MLNEPHNAETAGAISTDASQATVRVIRTDEELMIARSVCRLTLLFVGVAHPKLVSMESSGSKLGYSRRGISSVTIKVRHGSRGR